MINIKESEFKSESISKQLWGYFRFRISYIGQSCAARAPLSHGKEQENQAHKVKKVATGGKDYEG